LLGGYYLLQPGKLKIEGLSTQKVFVHPKKSMPKIESKKSDKIQKIRTKKVQNPRKKEKIRFFLLKSPNKIQKIQKS